jgi:hypothetical protein
LKLYEDRTQKVEILGVDRGMVVAYGATMMDIFGNTTSESIA